MLPEENLEEFDRLRADLEDEHQPATPTESLLVADIARHYWLYQRALRLQEECFALDITSAAAQTRLSLFLRYGTTHERAFRRCLTDLLKLRKQRLQLERGFESQKRQRAAERRREVAAQCRSLKGNQLGRVGNGTDPKEVNDIIAGFEALDDYFRITDDDPQVAKPKRKADQKAA